MKQPDVLGEMLSEELPVHSHFLSHKWDLRVLPRLIQHLRSRRIDALVTVGAGDKMFWGRIAARWTKTPVVISALHSTGWPDGIGRLNRRLTRWTDAFVAVADEHGRFLREGERFPAEKVHVIPNGIDTDRFRRDLPVGNQLRQSLGIPLDAPVCGILAALRPEKNHRLFLDTAQIIQRQFPDSHFLIVGDGPERVDLESYARSLGLESAAHFLGNRDDVPSLLSAINVLLLTSRNEANPVSILEGLSNEVPVVATRVGSVSATVIDGQTGYTAEQDPQDLADKALRLLADPVLAARLGNSGRALVVSTGSVDSMVRGYEELIQRIYRQKSGELAFDAGSLVPMVEQDTLKGVRL